jgi:ABC-2 type transport system ATP-binding protein
VVEADRRDGAIGYEVNSEQGRDVRRELAQAVVSSGFGLLELRPMRMSLEQVFLTLTTVEDEAGDNASTDSPQEVAAYD